jgi:ABC-type xylose transport system permease subunit
MSCTTILAIGMVLVIVCAEIGLTVENTKEAWRL